jgi:hypothetical protein
MIKFEFTVDEVDAENIFSCIRDAAIKNDERIIDVMSLNYPPDVAERYIAAYRRDKEYLLGLIEKMSNTRA